MRAAVVVVAAMLAIGSAADFAAWKAAHGKTYTSSEE
jgi:hypothetical protein